MVLLKKAAMLKGNTDSLQKVLQQKQQNLETVNDVIAQRRLMAQSQQQQQQQQQAAR